MSNKRSANESEGSSDEELNICGKLDNNNGRALLKCVICSKQYKNSTTLKQHMQSHIRKRKCEICEQSYTRIAKLRLHQQNVHGITKDKKQKLTSFTCSTCNKVFGREYHLRRHTVRVHGHVRQKRTQFSCRHCDCDFEDYDQLFEHVRRMHPLNQQGGKRARIATELNASEAYNQERQDQLIDEPAVDAAKDTVEKTSANEVASDVAAAAAAANDDDNNDNADQNQHVINPPIDESAVRNRVVNRYIHPRGSERYDVLVFLGNIRTQVLHYLQARARELGGIKWNLCVHVQMERDAGNEVAVASPYFRSRTYVTLSANDFNEHDLNEAMQKMFESLELYMREGSGLYVKKVLKLEIHTAVYKPLGGSTYLTLPKSLAKNRSLLNIENQDDKCFLYCLLASLHPMETGPERPEHYYQFAHEVNMSGVTYPVNVSQVRKVENQNEYLSINVFAYDDKTIVPLKITEKNQRPHHVNLLWLTFEDKSHYCLIRDLNRFLSSTNKHTGQLHYCNYCLHGFRKAAALTDHTRNCSRHGAQKVELPVAGKNEILEFSDYEKTLKVPFVIYADFETINRKFDTCPPNPNQSASSASSHLEVCGFGYKVVCEAEKYTKPSVVYRGKEAGKKLLECLLQEAEEIRSILSQVEPMNITEDQADLIDKAIECCLCKKKFTKYVRHHNHLTGEIIAASCNVCNLKCRQAKFIPVLFHNLKNFDAHIICQNLGQFKSHKLKCIAQNTERYVSFSLGDLRFIDSLQFLPSSLETLVENLAQEGLQAFPHLRRETGSEEEARLLLRKGVYPYEYMDSFARFDETDLPQKEHFYSSVKQEHISSRDYEHAQAVFETFAMASLGEYHDLYLKTDVVLLADIFEAFRHLCLKQYDLDPCHFYTSPGLSWSACLKMSKVQLELLTDIDMILMVESGIRGGISQISNRYETANNPYLKNYDPSKPRKFLMYYDANNLYGWAMRQPLPSRNFAFMDKSEVESFDIMSVPEDGDTGYIMEVSLRYPKYLHDRHNCLPLAPVKRIISNEELSPYAKQLLRKLHGLSEEDPLPKRGKVEKLLTTLEDKHRYVLHIQNLKLYLSLGMELTAIHRILKFTQEAWMKMYIDKNTILRQKATSTFQQNFFKLMNVSVFGKTMENVRQHKNIELVHTEERLRKVTAKPAYKTSRIFKGDLIAVELYKTKVSLLKPIYCGMSILDLSKCLMYDFWYNFIKEKYKNTAKLHMTDTDSLLFSCETEDIYEDMKASLDYFDTSSYPKDHAIYSDLNAKRVGKIRDETNGKPITQFVGLRSKMYSFLCDGEKEQKRAKGVAKVTVKRKLKHEHYKSVLLDKSSKISSMTCLRSHGHELFAETIQKTGLCAFDDKRYLMDAVNSCAYGHYQIAQDINDNSDNYNEDIEKQTLSIIPVEENRTALRKLEQDMFTIGDFKVTPCIKL